MLQRHGRQEFQQHAGLHMELCSYNGTATFTLSALTSLSTPAATSSHLSHTAFGRYPLVVIVSWSASTASGRCLLLLWNLSYNHVCQQEGLGHRHSVLQCTPVGNMTTMKPNRQLLAFAEIQEKVPMQLREQQVESSRQQHSAGTLHTTYARMARSSHKKRICMLLCSGLFPL